MSPHSSDTEQEDTGDRATRAREGGLCTFFEHHRVDGTCLTLVAETSLFRRASSNDESAFNDPFDREEAPRRSLISQGFAALRRSRARDEAFDAVDAVDDENQVFEGLDDPDDRSVLDDLFDEEEYDDFIAVGEDLVRRQVTAPRHLGIQGGSNGGLLVGAVLTQRPDLFNAVVCQVPLLDMLRYHMLLAGASWMAEYGDPDVAEERAFLEKLSPYHNVDPAKTYPEIYFETSTKDDRVHPGHARKMAKLLDEMGKPFLYYENIDGGHSAAANQREAAKRSALEFTYLARKLMDGK